MEREKINQLPKERQASYEQCAKHMKNDPEARLAMQSLLLEGKIPGTLSDQDNNDLLANLGMNTPPATGNGASNPTSGRSIDPR